MAGHSWRFLRAGGFDQVRVESGADSLALDELDMKLWVALACPVGGMEFDAKTLEVLDLDHDGRIRASEIIETVHWLKKVLKDPEILTGGSDHLPLAAIADETPEGHRVLASAKRILASRGKAGADEIAVEDAADTEHVFDQTDFNGDGVVPASAAADPDTARLIEDLIAVYGAVTDRSGKPGIDQGTADGFAAELTRFRDWWKQQESDPAILPLGADTHGAFLALVAVEQKIADYFERCRLSAFSAVAADCANPDEDFFTPLAGRPLADCFDLLRGMALAEIAPDRPLPLGGRINPVWREEMERFRRLTAAPILGEQAAELTEAAWRQLLETFAAHRAWRGAKPAIALDKLGEERVREISELDRKAELDRLIAKDKAFEDEASAIDDVLRLTLLCRDFLSLLNNFVAFREFYTRRNKATFQAGTLYLDGRSCDLCVKVADVAKHAAMATLSQIYLAYCECRRPVANETMFIAAAFTAGDSDQLMVGRNGIFYDRLGRDWDAVVVRIVDHPISMRQAFMAPYKQMGRFIGEQVEKLAQAKSKIVHDDLSQAISNTASTALKAPPPGPAKPATPAASAAAQQQFDIGRFAGVFAAIGLAIGAIGTALAHVGAAFLHLAWWQMPLALAGLVAVISGPSMVIAFVKLRQRNLAPLLDANGWAINARVKINIPFGGSLTQLAKLPEGAERSLNDPYAEKRVPWRLYLALLAMIGGAALAIYLYGGMAKLFHRLIGLL